MGKLICKIFSWPLLKMYELTGSYGVSLIFFDLIVHLILMPFMAKSKKGMMRTTRLQPRIQELQRRHEGNPQKLNQEMQKLYREEGVSPMGGCLWSLIPFPILIALYSVIRQPLERMMGLSDSQVSTITKWVTKNLNFSADGWGSYKEIGISDAIHNNWDMELDISHISKWDELLQEAKQAPRNSYFFAKALSLRGS